MNTIKTTLLALLVVTSFSCNKNEEEDITPEICTIAQVLDSSRGDCNETLAFTSQFQETISGATRVITANNIPNHKVGLFGRVAGALNPNAISEQSETYTISMNPTPAGVFTAANRQGCRTVTSW